MMKFEKQRIGQSHSSKLEISNPDYLTFRNNPCENTGRTVYSQQFDCRSLEKYPPDEEMSPLPKYNFKKNNLRNVRSQEKFRQIHEELIFERSNDENGQIGSSVQVERNQELKTRIGQLIKNIKRAQKKHNILEEEILNIQKAIEDNSQELARLNGDIHELTEISEENVNNYNNMLVKINELEEEARVLSQNAGFLEREAKKGQQDILTVRSRDGMSGQGYKKMMEGMREYQHITNDLSKQISHFEEEILRMENQLQQLGQLDQDLRHV